MERLSNRVHRMIRSHPILDRLREETGRGSEVVLFIHGDSGLALLGETNGISLREVAVVRGFPNPTCEHIRDLAAQLKPIPGYISRKYQLVSKQSGKRKEQVRNAGRFMREHTARLRKAQRGTRKDFPGLVWPKIKGEGV